MRCAAGYIYSATTCVASTCLAVCDSRARIHGERAIIANQYGAAVFRRFVVVLQNSTAAQHKVAIIICAVYRAANCEYAAAYGGSHAAFT